MSSQFLLNMALHTSGIGFFVSLISEILLLVLIVYKSRESFGHYKYLMIVYNVVLIMYSIATSNANLAAHSTETSYVLFRMYNGPNRTVGPLFILQFCTMYVTMLIILSVHFIYRYVAIFYHRYIWIFNKFYLGLWVLGSFTLGMLLISLKYFFLGEFPHFTEQLREEFLTNYNLTMDQVLYNGPIYYICDEKDVCTKPIGVWLTMLALCSCFVICLAVMGYFGTRCYYRLYQMKSELSEHTRKMQKQLLFALVIQAGIPIVIMYTPTALLLVSPIVGVSFGAYSNIAVSMVAVYPPLDQLAIIWIIRDYRNAIKRE
ncbi:CRE-STR-84 protein [Caenorhabditis remanei]|uniref:Serpentine receptor class r-10 n=1 Tax=Caenorhabditis remanei TaxID=31234 RepID=E3NMP4_CAERE|nr:CRE-STR-84 protein [Caenorhabditis remanei]